MEIEQPENEIIKDKIFIKRKLKQRLRTRNKKLKKKTLFDVKSLECIDGDRLPIQRLDRNKTKAKLSAQTPSAEQLNTSSEDANVEVGANNDHHHTQENVSRLNFINSQKVSPRSFFSSL